MKYLKVLCCLTLVFCLGCASAMEWQYKHPALPEGAPHALINEEDLSANLITSSIKGFRTDPSAQEEKIQEPVMKNYSTGTTAAKAIYSFSPWGLATAPFADWTGKTIAVPPGRIGIVIHHVYHKELSRETVVDFREGERYDMTSKSIETMPRSDDDKNDIQVVTFEHYEWDDTMWADLKPHYTYILYLSKNTLVGPNRETLSVLTNGKVTLPSDVQIQKSKAIVTAKYNQHLGDDIEYKEDGSIVIKDKDGSVSVTIKREKKK